MIKKHTRRVFESGKITIETVVITTKGVEEKCRKSRLDAIPGNELLDTAFSFVNQWAIEKRGCEHYIDNGSSVIWVSDFNEYLLEYDSFSQECMLTGYNVELNNHVLFYIPAGQTQDYFENIMKLLGHY
jgi:hypothetical protein